MKAFTSLIITYLALNAHGLPSSQIVGGNNAPDGLYPYQASLRYSNQHLCGGAIITNRHTLTTASCVSSYEPFDLRVAVGSNYLNKSGAIYQVIKIQVHAGYNELLGIHDIALLHISKDIAFNENVQPIALPNADRDYNDYPLIATGWGKDKAWGSSPNRLQEIILKGYPQRTCNYIYKGKVKESHICTFTAYNEGICDGDHGGPLVGDNVLVGLISYGLAPCANGFADVHTRVFYYRTWIEYHTNKSQN